MERKNSLEEIYIQTIKKIQIFVNCCRKFSVENFRYKFKNIAIEIILFEIFYIIELVYI